MKPKVNALLDKLVATYLSRGVQPSDICDLLFEKDYVDYKIEKSTDTVIMTVSFIEIDCESTSKQTMKYTYDLERNLQTIEQKSGRSPFRVQWSRKEVLRELLMELKRLGCDIQDIKGMPQDLIENYLKAYSTAA